MLRIGVDLGGTNIAAGLVDEEYRILDRVSVKTKLPHGIRNHCQAARRCGADLSGMDAYRCEGEQPDRRHHAGGRRGDFCKIQGALCNG